VAQALRRNGHAAYAVLRRIAFMNPFARPSACFIGARIAWNEGRRRKALKLWEQSAAAAECLGMPYEQATARLALARHLPPGYLERAGQLKRAADLFEVLGLRHDADQARELTSHGAG
jgi:hypothetical protein